MTTLVVSSVTRRRLPFRRGVRETRVGRRRRRRQSCSTERRSNEATDRNDEEKGATSFRCVRLGDDEDTFDNLPGACAAVRTRSFYEFGENSDADADSDSDARSFKKTDDADDDSNRLTVDIKARLDWWSDRILSEKLREAKFQRVGMRVITFAALVPSDSAGLVDFAYAVDGGAKPNN